MRLAEVRGGSKRKGTRRTNPLAGNESRFGCGSSRKERRNCQTAAAKVAVREKKWSGLLRSDSGRGRTHKASELKRLTAFSGSSSGRRAPAVPSASERKLCQPGHEGEQVSESGRTHLRASLDHSRVNPESRCEIKSIPALSGALSQSVGESLPSSDDRLSLCERRRQCSRSR